MNMERKDGVRVLLLRAYRSVSFVRVCFCYGRSLVISYGITNSRHASANFEL